MLAGKVYMKHHKEVAGIVYDNIYAKFELEGQSRTPLQRQRKMKYDSVGFPDTDWQISDGKLAR